MILFVNMLVYECIRCYECGCVLMGSNSVLNLIGVDIVLKCALYCHMLTVKIVCDFCRYVI